MLFNVRVDYLFYFNILFFSVLITVFTHYLSKTFIWTYKNYQILKLIFKPKRNINCLCLKGLDNDSR